MSEQFAKDFFEAPFLRKNRFEITRETNQIHVTINGRIEVLCAVEGTYLWSTHPLDFVRNASVVLDVLVDGERVTEDYAFKLLRKVYDYPLDQGMKRVFCNHLLGNRIGNAARNRAVTCKLRNGLEILVSCLGEKIVAKTKNGITLIAKPSKNTQNNGSVFTYRLASLIRADKSELEKAALHWVSIASEYAVETAKIRKNVATTDMATVEMIAKAVAFHENLNLVTIMGHYNAGHPS
jgi:hypothetical protein